MFIKAGTDKKLTRLAAVAIAVFTADMDASRKQKVGAAGRLYITNGHSVSRDEPSIHFTAGSENSGCEVFLRPLYEPLRVMKSMKLWVLLTGAVSTLYGYLASGKSSGGTTSINAAWALANLVSDSSPNQVRLPTPSALAC